MKYVVYDIPYIERYGGDIYVEAGTQDAGPPPPQE